MALALYGHLFSSYSWKALIAFYENDTPFEFRDVEDPARMAELTALWPMKQFPLLVDGDKTVFEATSIIEYLHVRHPGPVRLLPADPANAVEVRTLDRVFDNYVMTPQGKCVFDAIRPEADRDPYGVAQARQTLDTIYAWLDKTLEGRTWAAGDDFTLADCAAAPSLFYADWTHRIDEKFQTLLAYRARLLARRSVKRCVDDARPYRHYFPLGAPDRD